MKKYLDDRFAAVMSLVVIGVFAGGCVLSSSKNLNAGNIAEQTPGQSMPVDREKETYRIYSAILDHGWNKGNIVVRDHTDRGLFQNDDWLDTNVGKSYPDAVSDFKSANEKDRQLENGVDFTGKIALIDQDEFKNTINGSDGWDAFKKNHPGAAGIVTFSAVGFSRDGNHAVVNVSYLCYSHCGNGSFYVLEKKNGEWTIAQEIGTWIS